MTSRKTSVHRATTNLSPFLLAPVGPKSPLDILGTQGKTGDRVVRQPKAKTVKSIHRRLVSDLHPPGIDKKTNLKPRHQPLRSEARSNSPKNPFSDLGGMLDFLSLKLSKKQVKSSPYGSPNHGNSPKSSHSPKIRKSSKQASPKIECPRAAASAAVCHIDLKLESGHLKAPKLYQNQIFEDVFDQEGNHEKLLFSSDEDLSLEIYQTVDIPSRPHEGVMTFAPAELGFRRKPEKKEMKALVEATLEISQTPEKEVRNSLKRSEADNLGEVLLQKLTLLHDGKGDRSQSETACEECRDSHKRTDSQKFEDLSLSSA